MSTKTMKEKAAELLQKCEVVTLASVNKEGYPRPVPMSKIAAEGISTIWTVSYTHLTLPTTERE